MYKTGVINDPLGQPTVPAGSDCRLILKFWDGRTDGQTLCVKIVITTGRDCGRPSGSINSRSWLIDTAIVIIIFKHVIRSTFQSRKKIKQIFIAGWPSGSFTTPFDSRPSTNQNTSLKSGSLFLVMVYVRPYIRTYKTKHTDQRVKPLFKLVLWLVLGRGSLYDSSLVLFIHVALGKLREYPWWSSEVESVWGFFELMDIFVWFLLSCACCP